MSSQVSAFLQSFRPAILWFRFIGVQLQVEEKRSAICRFFLFIFNLLLICMNVLSTVYDVIILYPDPQRKDDAVFHLNIFAHQIYFAFRSISVHLLLVIFVRNSWSKVALCIEQFATRIRVRAGYYGNIKKMCRLGVIYILCKECLLAALIAGGCSTLGQFSYQMMVVDLIANLMDLFPLSALFLFCALGWSVALSFRAIRHEMKEMALQLCQASANDATSQLNQWKRSYSTACKAARRLNSCFAWILLIETLYIFIEVIFTSYFVISVTTGRKQLSPWWVMLSFTLKGFSLVQLFAMSYVADAISAEGSKVMKTLTSLELPVSLQGSQLHLMFQVHCTNPEINVLGFFSIGRKIIPTLLATTITYLIILYQFQNDKK